MDVTGEIRAAREADLDTLTDVWERAARSSHGFMDPDEFTAMRPFIRDSYLPSMDVWLAEVDGTPVAFVGAQGSHVELLYIDPPFHGLGIGTRLIQHVGATSVEVYAGNTSGLGFYRSRGFTETARRDHDPAGRPYPMVVLRHDPDDRPPQSEPPFEQLRRQIAGGASDGTFAPGHKARRCAASPRRWASRPTPSPRPIARSRPMVSSRPTDARAR
ncbi:GNAT family N-acetyltransferase [Aeromicrobium sp. UC242_57]|uniref:GNAT family N-acetyltransferase n=1 Tax=Aeromicrobium sp. UC242_57 TaxID=3374624 RepID=UPI0037AE5D8B